MNALSPQDRALIEAAVAAGRVTVVPRGVSGLPPMVWDGEANALRYVDRSQQPMRAKIAAGYRGRKGPRPPHPDVLARRERLADLHGHGMTVAQIVAETGYSDSLVRLDMSKMKLHAHRAPLVAAANRAAQVAALAAQGKDTQAIALATGLTAERVYRIGLRQDLGLAPPVNSVWRAQVRAFDDAVRAAVAEGLTIAAIRQRLDVTAARLRESMKRQNLKAPKAPPVGPVRRARLDARAAEVRRMAGEGMLRVQIAAALGVTTDTVRNIARAHEIDVATGRPGRPAGPDKAFRATPDRRPRPAEALRQRVGDLYRQGLSWRQIAEAADLTVGTVGYHLRMLGIVKAARVDAALMARVDDLRKVKATSRMVAEVLGVTVRKARALLREAEQAAARQDADQAVAA